jgi:hypothetical protein
MYQRIIDFIENVEVNDAISHEEKEIILGFLEKQLSKNSIKNDNVLTIKKGYDIIQIEKKEIIKKPDGKIFDSSICRMQIENWDDGNEFYDEDEFVEESCSSILLQKDDILQIINYLQIILNSSEIPNS